MDLHRLHRGRGGALRRFSGNVRGRSGAISAVKFLTARFARQYAWLSVEQEIAGADRQPVGQYLGRHVDRCQNRQAGWWVGGTEIWIDARSHDRGVGRDVQRVGKGRRTRHAGRLTHDRGDQLLMRRQDGIGLERGSAGIGWMCMGRWFARFPACCATCNAMSSTRWRRMKPG